MMILCMFARPVIAARAIVAEAGDPIRKKDGRIDIPATIDVLKQMRVNTYLYTVWQHEKDLEDLAAFAEAARAAKIQVWVYLLPWSETKADRPNSPVQAPYANDYVAWVKAIGELSRRHPNINGWVMDDFWENVGPERFNEDTIAGLVRLGRKYNPDLKFYPVLYFAQPWAEFVDRFGRYVDGVIVCYPQSAAQIDNASNYLRDGGHGPSVMFECGSRAQIPPKTVASAKATVRVPKGASLVFYFDQQSVKRKDAEFSRKRAHRAYLSVNGKEIWSDEIARPGESDDGIVTIPLPEPGRHGILNIEIGIAFDKNGSTGQSLKVRFDDIRIIKEQSKRHNRIREFDTAWKVEGPNVLHPQVQPSSSGEGKFDIPMFILFGTEPNQHQKRHNEPGTPQNVAAKLRLGVDAVRTGQANGIVGWYTPKDRSTRMVAVFADTAKAVYEAAEKR